MSEAGERCRDVSWQTEENKLDVGEESPTKGQRASWRNV